MWSWAPGPCCPGVQCCSYPLMATSDLVGSLQAKLLFYLTSFKIVFSHFHFLLPTQAYTKLHLSLCISQQHKGHLKVQHWGTVGRHHCITQGRRQPFRSKGMSSVSILQASSGCQVLYFTSLKLTEVSGGIENLCLPGEESEAQRGK